ncbi:homoserine dehydrogenase [Marivirga lumbricoides]|uniref:Homoserine dehydrogenase n=1 Tax=Marivirga lumbricoides TaxID=1046115 RepID=A0ABQ1LYR4_9BACT|nr:homoserine dehydrogenase [Marivirga lumbricoides]
MKKYRAGLFGLGVVGSGVFQTLSNNKDFPISIEKIAVKNPGKKRNIEVDASKIYTDASELLEDESLEIIIELINDPHEAFQIVSQALRNGKKVVTANKKMISLYHQELLQLSSETDGTLLYEAAVCGSIPVIRLLDQQFGADEINKVTTIANGTCNYILTQMSAKGWSYTKALQEAQNLGFAELDPYSDVSGEDTRFKLSIIILHSFGVHIKADDIPMVGIEHIDDSAIEFASENKVKIKLVGQAIQKNGSLSASVIPQFVEASEDIFFVDEEYNAVQIDAKYANRQFFKGKGAGSFPTSSAVVSNLSDIIYNRGYQLPASLTTFKKIEPTSDYYYVAGNEEVLHHLNVEEILVSETNYKIVKASLGTLLETSKEGAALSIINLPESLLKKLANTHAII